MDKVRAVKDFVASVLAFVAGVGLFVVDDTTTSAILTAVGGVGSLLVTLFGGGNAPATPAEVAKANRPYGE
jgi:hypothetical protein